MLSARIAQGRSETNHEVHTWKAHPTQAEHLAADPLYAVARHGPTRELLRDDEAQAGCLEPIRAIMQGQKTATDRPPKSKNG